MTGMTGYTQLNPKTDEICQLISFKNAIPPLELQQQPTIFERLSAQDVRVTSSGLPKFAFSALTQAALRGSDYIPTMIRENGLQPRRKREKSRTDIPVSA